VIPARTTVAALSLPLVAVGPGAGAYLVAFCVRHRDKLCELIRDQEIGLRIVIQVDEAWFDRFDA
jgi:hypothetical protein